MECKENIDRNKLKLLDIGMVGLLFSASLNVHVMSV